MAEKKVKLYVISEEIEEVEVGTPEEPGYKYEYLTKPLNIKRIPAPKPRVLKTIPVSKPQAKKTSPDKKEDAGEALTRIIREEDRNNPELAPEAETLKGELKFADEEETDESPKKSEEKSATADKEKSAGSGELQQSAEKELDFVDDDEEIVEELEIIDDEVEKSEESEENSESEEKKQIEKIDEKEETSGDAETEKNDEADETAETTAESGQEAQPDDAPDTKEESESADKTDSEQSDTTVKDAEKQASEEDELEEISDDLDTTESDAELPESEETQQAEENIDDLAEKIEEVGEIEEKKDIKADTDTVQPLGELGDPNKFDEELAEAKTDKEKQIAEIDSEFEELPEIDEVDDDEILEDIEVVEDDESDNAMQTSENEGEKSQEKSEEIEEIEELKDTTENQESEEKLEKKETQTSEDVKKKAKIPSRRKPTAKLLASGKKKTKNLNKKDETTEQSDTDEKKQGEEEAETEEKEKKGISHGKYLLIVWSSMIFTVLVLAIVLLDWIGGINLLILLGLREEPKSNGSGPTIVVDKNVTKLRLMMQQLNKNYAGCKNSFNRIMTQFRNNSSPKIPEEQKVPLKKLQKDMKTVLSNLYFTQRLWYELLVANMKIYERKDEDPEKGDLSVQERSAYANNIKELRKLIEVISKTPAFTDLLNDKEVLEQKKLMEEKRQIYLDYKAQLAKKNPAKYKEVLETEFDNANSDRLSKYDAVVKLVRKIKPLIKNNKDVSKERKELIAAGKEALKAIWKAKLAYLKLATFTKENKLKLDSIVTISYKKLDGSLKTLADKLAEGTIDFAEIEEAVKEIRAQVEELAAKLGK